MLALAGCVAQMGAAPGVPVRLGQASAGGAPSGHVAILLPLSGPRAEIAQALLKGAQLALAGPGAPSLDVRDTAGTPQGAATAAQAAIAGGAGLILGPLTSAETAAVAPVAQQAGIAVLAFTNDPAQGRPGVWPLGITPRQQVTRLVEAARSQGKSQFAGLLPETDFGRAMAVALQEATAAAGLPPPRIRQHGTGMAAINTATRDLSDYASRGGAVDARIRAARASRDAEGRRQAAELSQQRGAVAPPPFDSLLLADTGEPLAEIASLLPYYDIRSSAVRILGPALWATPSSGSGQFSGAWYAAPDPAARAGFNDAYTAKFGTPAPAIADLAFDAASIARVLAQNGGFSAAALTQPGGFAGTDGLMALQPDGRVRRGLAVFEIQRGGPQLVEPAPQSFAAPGV
jgi:branched-chain amino acid transport system substrate-binding protein